MIRDFRCEIMDNIQTWNYYLLMEYIIVLLLILILYAIDKGKTIKKVYRSICYNNYYD